MADRTQQLLLMLLLLLLRQPLLLLLLMLLLLLLQPLLLLLSLDGLRLSPEVHVQVQFAGVEKVCQVFFPSEVTDTFSPLATQSAPPSVFTTESDPNDIRLRPLVHGPSVRRREFLRGVGIGAGLVHQNIAIV